MALSVALVAVMVGDPSRDQSLARILRIRTESARSARVFLREPPSAIRHPLEGWLEHLATHDGNELKVCSGFLRCLPAAINRPTRANDVCSPVSVTPGAIAVWTLVAHAIAIQDPRRVCGIRQIAERGWRSCSRKGVGRALWRDRGSFLHQTSAEVCYQEPQWVTLLARSRTTPRGVARFGGSRKVSASLSKIGQPAKFGSVTRLK